MRETTEKMSKKTRENTRRETERERERKRKKTNSSNTICPLLRGPCDRKDSILIGIYNPGLKFQFRSRSSTPMCLFAGPSQCTEKGSIEKLNPRSIARSFQPGRLRLKLFNPNIPLSNAPSILIRSPDCSHFSL